MTFSANHQPLNAIDQAIGQKLMVTFEGPTPSADFLTTLTQQHLGGVTLFRDLGNIVDPAQIRTLTTMLQEAAATAGQPPLLIAVDQEGGQLMPISNGPTRFPGNLALGATGSVELAQQAGYALGRELAAIGINVDYAPACDVNSNPKNPVISTRSFGEDSLQVADLSAAMVTGLQAAGVAATAKHFPGHGDTATDSHHETPVVSHDEARLRQVEWPPFRAAIGAGVQLVMLGHIALPTLQEGAVLPASLSSHIIIDRLRGELGFSGVTITDSLDMGAIRQGPGLLIDAVAAAAAGEDLLLLKTDPLTQQRLYEALLQAVQRGLLSRSEILISAGRIAALKQWLDPTPRPALEIVGCGEHRALADEIAAQSITLVRDEARRLPLRLSAEDRVAVIIPEPTDLTPADTSSQVTCRLADAIRRRHTRTIDFTLSHQSTETDIVALRQEISDYDLVIVGTLNAYTQAEQAALVNVLLASDLPMIVVAMRMPYDLQAFPTAPTYLCSYSILEPSMEAVAQVLWGERPASGRLPVSIPSLYPVGHQVEPQ